MAGKPAVYDEISMVLFIHGYLIVMEGEKEALKATMGTHLKDLMADTELYVWDTNIDIIPADILLPYRGDNLVSFHNAYKNTACGKQATPPCGSTSKSLFHTSSFKAATTLVCRMRMFVLTRK